MTKKRVLLSLQIYSTQRLLLTFLTVSCVLLGTVYIFLFNRVAMRGYVLQQETEKNYNLTTQKEELNSKIAQYQTQDFISEAPIAQSMMMSNSKTNSFAIVKENIFTAQK